MEQKQGVTNKRYVDAAMKKCHKCKVKKPLYRFHNSSRHRDGKASLCAMCRNLITKAQTIKRRRENLELERDKSARNYRSSGFYTRIRRQYGLTQEEFEGILERQGNACAVCQMLFPEGNTSQRRHIDHCHKTDKVRGVLCQSCNMGIGLFKDSPELLQAAISYLETNGGIQ